MSTRIKRLTDEEVALLERLAPKAGDALSKIHGMATCKDPAKRGEFVYMSIPARAEVDADLILGDIARLLPALVDEVRRRRWADVEDIRDL